MATVRRLVRKRVKLAASRERRAITPKLFICGLDGRWCQIREATAAPNVETTKTKIKGKGWVLTEDVNGRLRRTPQLREQDLTVHVFTGGKVLATVPTRTVQRIGLYPTVGAALEVPVKFVPTVRKGCEYEQSLLEGD